jgi:hypothetical protein
MGNRKKTDHGRPTEPEKPEKQTPLPGWSRRLAISMAEEVIMSGATNSIIVAEDSRQPTEGDDTTPLVFQSKGSQDSGGFEQPLSHHGGSSNLSQTSLEYSQQNYGHSLESLPKEARQISHSQDSSDAVSLPTTSLHLAGAGATLQESGTGPEIGIAAQPVFANNQRAAPNLFMRAKAGHYATRSPLVAPDTEDLERHAKAMTNGKGDWRNRVTQMLQVLSAPPKNRALTEGSPSRTAPEAPAAQNLATMSLPNSISGAPKKRSFSEFNVDDAGALRSNSSRIPSFSIQNGQNMSPKARREEHARKRQAKQEALDKAKAEADALRRQVAEIEAGQAEAIAREEAEVSQDEPHE